MPWFEYLAKKSPEETIRGKIEAEKVREVTDFLTGQGYFPVEIVKLGDNKKGKEKTFKKVRNKELSESFRQLSDLLQSGMTLNEGLELLIKQSGSRELIRLLTSINDKIGEGLSLSGAMKTFTGCFPEYAVALIRAGELGGKLEEMLGRIAQTMERNEDIKVRVFSALAYPLLMLLVGIGTVLTLVVYVIPKLSVMFEDFGELLPLPTRIILFFSRVLTEYHWPVLLIIIILFILIKRLLKAPENRLKLDSVLISLPVIGRIQKSGDFSRIFRTFSILIASGVSITEAINTVRSIAGNSVIGRDTGALAERIEKGLGLSAAMEKGTVFSPLVINSVRVGENSGTLENNFARIADRYERDLERDLKIITSLIEPVLILVIGAVICFIVIAMLLPLFQLNFFIK